MHVRGLLRLAPTIKFQSLTLGDVALARRLSSAESLDDPRMVRRRAISSVTDHGNKKNLLCLHFPSSMGYIIILINLSVIVESRC